MDLPFGTNGLETDTLHTWWAIWPYLLAGEYPGSFEGSPQKIEYLLKKGFTKFVNLTHKQDQLTPYYKPEWPAPVSGFEYVSVPILDRGVLKLEEYDPIVNQIVDWIDAEQHVYVHCWGGIGRTATVIGCVLAACRSGMTAEDVFDCINLMRSGTWRAPWPAPQTEEQREIIYAYCERRDSTK